MTPKILLAFRFYSGHPRIQLAMVALVIVVAIIVKWWSNKD